MLAEIRCKANCEEACIADIRFGITWSKVIYSGPPLSHVLCKHSSIAKIRFERRYERRLSIRTFVAVSVTPSEAMCGSATLEASSSSGGIRGHCSLYQSAESNSATLAGFFMKQLAPAMYSSVSSSFLSCGPPKIDPRPPGKILGHLGCHIAWRVGLGSAMIYLELA